MRDMLLVLVAIGMIFLGDACRADDAGVEGLIRKYCHECHSGTSAEAGIRLDSLTLQATDETAESRWQRIYDKLQTLEMPPDDANQPSDSERRSLNEAIANRLRDANLKRRGNEGRAPLRRLTRFEYENTLHDLLGIDTSLIGFLPEDATADGFDKVASALRLSPVHLEQYMAAAGAAIDAAIVHEPPVEPIQDTYVVATNKGDVYLRQGKRFIIDDGVVLFGGVPAPTIQWKSPAQGNYRFRFLLETHQSSDPLTCVIRAGDFTRRTGVNHLVGYFDVEPGGKRQIEFQTKINAGEGVSFDVFGIDGKPKLRPDGTNEFPGPGIWIGPIAIEGPLNHVFPPESHRRLFGDLPLKPVKGQFNPSRTKRRRDRTEYHEVGSSDPATDAARLLHEFAAKAFRRPVAEPSLRPFLSLVTDRLSQGVSFEKAMRTGFIAILCSSDFLFITQPRSSTKSSDATNQPLDDFELASRLSYFLWSSMPDAELIRLASDESLRKNDVLHNQVERMLRDPKSQRFTHDFVDQWLDLKLIDFTTPDRRLYPDFDEVLKVSMVEESRRFFRHILEQNLSVSNFIDSDFAIINERLAVHYGIDNVVGQEFRRVDLPPDSHRGGVLTQAAVLKVTADGTRTSPVLRGVWALERIIGRPVPPPPPGTPGIEPDIRGATTIREQLAKHREVESCAVCHRHIDPLGFAMESFDVIGGWRDKYRTTQPARVISEAGYRRKIAYRNGPDVDPADQLHDGRKFDGMGTLKRLLAEDRDQIARCLIQKLVAYSTGCGIEFADRPAAEAILKRTRDSNYGLKSMIHEIVQSDLFRNK